MSLVFNVLLLCLGRMGNVGSWKVSGDQ